MRILAQSIVRLTVISVIEGLSLLLMALNLDQPGLLPN